MRSAWLSAVIVAVSLVALGTQFWLVDRVGFLVGDFRAFYCAAKVTVEHHDPYLNEPLHTCETSYLGETSFFHQNPNVTIPAPLPGYAIAAFVPLAMLPFPLAATLWSLLLLLACIVAVSSLARFANLPWQVTTAMFSLSLGVLSIPLGEIVPLAVALIMLAAMFAWKGRLIAAALCAAASLIEPHLGLPICVALFIWVGETRLTLIICGMFLATVSFITLGTAVNLEYVTSVLPAHALSEITRDTQYSLSTVLFATGVPAGLSIRLGTVWYAVMAAGGCVLAGVLAKRTGNRAFMVCVPPALVVFGGTFIHMTQIAVALPAAALLLGVTKGARRVYVLGSLLLLAVPWGWVISIALLGSAIYPIAFLAWQLSSNRFRTALIAGVGAALLSLMLIALPAAPQRETSPENKTRITIDTRLPEASWSAFSGKMSSHNITAWAVRIPTWVGLGMMIVLLLGETWSQPFAAGREPLRTV